MSVKVKIPLVIVLLVAFSVALTGLYLYSESSKIVINKAIDEMNSDANIIGQEFFEMVEAEELQTEMLAQYPQFVELIEARQNMAEEEFYSSNNPIFDEAYKIIQSNYSLLGNVFVADSNGEILVDNDRSNMKLNIKERDYFSKAMSGEFAISNALISKNDSDNVVVFATPIKNQNGQSIGIAANVVPLTGRK